MNVKKLSLASLFLVLSCSFGFAETFVKVTKMSQIVPGNRYVILYHNGSTTAAVSTINKGIAHDVVVEESNIGSKSMYYINTTLNVEGKPDAIRLDALEDGSYALYTTATNQYLRFGAKNGHLEKADTPTPWTLTLDETSGTFQLLSNGLYLRAFHPTQPATPQWAGGEEAHNLEFYLVYGGEDEEGTRMITFGRSTAVDESGEPDLKYYASVCIENDFLLDNDVTAYGIAEPFTAPVHGYNALNLVKVRDPYELVWAGSPVILVIENDDEDAPAEIEYPIYVADSKSTDKAFETNLVGTLEEIEAPENSYKLGRIGDVVGFWYAYGNGTIKANKAYIQAAEGSEIKGFTFNFADATGIKEVSAPEVNNDAIYNLVGQQVTKNYKGVVVKNGKKFLNK